MDKLEWNRLSKFAFGFEVAVKPPTKTSAFVVTSIINRVV